MPSLILTIFCLFAALLAAPFGMLPSILIFRDVANGTDAGASRKQFYAATLWFGMLSAWLFTASVFCVMVSILQI